MAMTLTRTSGSFHCVPHTVLCPNRQMAMCVPLVLDIIRRPLEPPIRQVPASTNLLLQSFTVGTELRIRPILATHLEFVVQELVADVTAVFVVLLREGIEVEGPAVACRQRAAELVVVRIIHGIVAIAAVNKAVGEVPDAIW